MNWDAVSAIAEVVGVTVVVASLVYIAIQVKQANRHATAASEIEWINAWNHIINSWTTDERTTSILRKGFKTFYGMSKSEQAFFHMRVSAMVNQWILVQKLSERNLISQDIADEATKVVVATLATKGGYEFFKQDSKLTPRGADLLRRVTTARENNEPTLTEILPWWSEEEPRMAAP